MFPVSRRVAPAIEISEHIGARAPVEYPEGPSRIPVHGQRKELRAFIETLHVALFLPDFQILRREDADPGVLEKSHHPFPVGLEPEDPRIPCVSPATGLPGYLVKVRPRSVL